MKVKRIAVYQEATDSRKWSAIWHMITFFMLPVILPLLICQLLGEYAEYFGRGIVRTRARLIERTFLLFGWPGVKIVEEEWDDE